MELIKPLAGLIPTGNYPQQVIAPPYDVINSAEAREFAKDKPFSFLHISKPEIDLDEHIDPYSQAVYEQGRHYLQDLIERKVLVQDDKEYYYIYRMSNDTYCQTGFVCLGSIHAYNEGWIRRHELTRPQKENDRANHIDTLNAQISPLLLCYRQQAEITESITQVTANESLIDVMAYDGVRHQLWRITDIDIAAQLNDAFNDLDLVYIADGHHRSAAATRVAERRETLADPDRTENYFLSVLFPANELNILGYHRVFRGLNLDKATLFAKLEKDFQIVALDNASEPKLSSVFHLYVENGWWQVSLKSVPKDLYDPLAKLPVSLLTHNMIEPIFDIMDSRSDKRINFIGGESALQTMQQKVDNGDYELAVSLKATTIDELLAVADENRIMPPKSTWFEPKLADGLVSYCF